MSKKEVSSKNLRLSNIAIIVAIVATILIIFSSHIVQTIVILIAAVLVLKAVAKKLDKVKK